MGSGFIKGTAIFLLCCFANFSLGDEDLPSVRIFATGGTIHSKADQRQKLMEYSDGKVSVAQLLTDLPELAEVAKLSTFELANVGSSSITGEMLIQLARQINAWLATPEATGAVVTHGTSSLEETAYFLNLTVRSAKPVVVVGAMRPFTAVSRDGPFNLYNAVRVAASPLSQGMGTLVVLNDEISAARDVTKSNTYRMNTFVSRDFGPLGYADADRIAYYRKPLYRHTTASEFDIDSFDQLPRVDITYSHQEADATAIEAFVEANTKGVVLTSTSKLDDVIGKAQQQGVIFIKSDRKGSGRVAESAKQAEQGIVTSDNLNPHKARILLRLALTKTSDPKEIQRMFNEY